MQEATWTKEYRLQLAWTRESLNISAEFCNAECLSWCLIADCLDGKAFRCASIFEALFALLLEKKRH